MVSDTMKRAIEAKFMMDFEDTQELDCVDIRDITERRNGTPCTLSVPFYDLRTGKWTYDPNHFSNPERAYQEATRRLP